MKSIWTPGLVRWHWLREAHPVTIWVLWGAMLALLGLWLLGIATGHTFNGWIHLFAGAAVITAAFCTYQIFRYGEFLERIPKGDPARSATGWRFRKRRGQSRP
jgi:hypothetical protein